MEKIASSYLRFMARRFPVMCASDEFHLLPRAAEAGEYFDQVDNLDRLSLEESIFVLQDYAASLERQGPEEQESLDDLIDRELVKASVAGALMDLSGSRSWCCNPLLYLKIAFIALDHALTKPCGTSRERVHRTRSRLEGMCRLMRQGMKNLSRIPLSLCRAATFMAGDCDRYLEGVFRVVRQMEPGLHEDLHLARAALGEFAAFLGSVAPVPDSTMATAPVELVVRDHFRSSRSLEEIYEIGGEEWSECLGKLQALGKTIDGGRSWRELYHGYLPEEAASRDTLELYEREMESLRTFFRGHGFTGAGDDRFPLIRPTPVYLESVRSSASFCAAFTRDAREADFFYITAALPQRRGRKASELLRRRLHREYRFLTAHETFPGHFLLDATRRMLPNPVRAQIESSLFYEGWAYYVESLLVDYGYVEQPVECLVDLKRRLWRAARCRIDTGLAAGFLSMDDAVEMLITTGFAREEAVAQVERFRLNPGYQLCYSLGRYEIVRLREKYGSAMGMDRFHQALLDTGEVPFHLLDRKLAEITSLERQADRSAL